MTALLIEANGGNSAAVRLSRKPLMRGPIGGDRSILSGGEMRGETAAFEYDEAWRQKLLFANPELILLDGVDMLGSEVVPLCRELTLPRPGGNVFLDLLGVTRRSRLVLVEC